MITASSIVELNILLKYTERFRPFSFGPHQSKVIISYHCYEILKIIIKSRKNCSNVTIKISVTYKIIILLKY